MQGEWAVTRTVALSEDIGPAEIVLAVMAYVVVAVDINLVTG